jgi:hypothetical protein
VPRRLLFSEHALDRMLEWRLEVADVEAATELGETIEEYEDGSRLLLGRSGLRPLDVVVDDVAPGVTTVVITVYEPDPERWDATFRERKRP